MTMADFDWKARFGPIINELAEGGLDQWANLLRQQLTNSWSRDCAA